MEESKGRNPNPGRTDRRQERDPSSREAERGRNPKSRRRKSDVRTDRSHERDPSSREARRENATQRRDELAQSSKNPVRTSGKDCPDYMRTGRCGYGRSCEFNHPVQTSPIPVLPQLMVQASPYPFLPQLMVQPSPYPFLPQLMVQPSLYPFRPQLPERTQMRHETVQTSPFPVRPGEQDCEYYLRTGRCGYGSNCHFNHPPVRPKSRTNCKMDIPPMRQGSERAPIERFQGANVVARFKRTKTEQGEGNIAKQRIEGEEMVQSQNTERSPRRETEESEEERGMKEQEQEQADIESQVREAEEKAQEQLRRDTEREKQQLQAQQQQEMKSQQQQEFTHEQQQEFTQEQQQEATHKQQQEVTQEQQQESPPPPQQQHQSLASQFDIYPLVGQLADAVETGTRDTDSDALVTGITSYFSNSLQLLNSLSRSLGSTTMTVSGERRKLEESEKLLQQRRDVMEAYRKSLDDILKKEP